MTQKGEGMENLLLFENHQVEVFELNGKVLFNPYHVGDCLELSDEAVRKAMSRMNPKQVVKVKNSDVTNGNIRKLNNAGENFLTESGVYKLVFKSRKPNAEAFSDWVTDEVLPSIRKTGSYNNPQNMSPAEQIKLIATGYVEMSEKIDNVEKELENFKNDMPLLGVEETRITTAVRSKGVRVLGGKDSNAYADKSLRRRVFSDIYRELKRQFQVGTYKAIKRSQCEVALEIINDYEPPLALEEEIRDCNAQESFVSEIA